MRRRIWVGALVFVAALTTVGCKRGAGGKFDEKPYLGTWLEFRDASEYDARRPMPQPKTPNLRLITISADRTYRVEMRTSSGGALGKPEVVEGTWDVQDGDIVFTSQKNTLDARYRTGEPARVVGVSEQSPAAKLCTIEHADGDLALYRRQE